MVLKIDKISQKKSFAQLSILGYLIFFLVIIDYVTFLYPLQFLNPYWEFEVIGNIVETFLAPLFAFILIFIPRDVSILERKILKWLSRFVLFMAIFLLLLLPLFFFDVQRINKNNMNAYNEQIMQQNQQFTQLEKIINQSSQEQLKNLLRQNTPSNQELPQIESQQDLEIYFMAVLTNNKRNTEKVTKNSFNKTNLELKKTAIKRGAGLIICSLLLFYLSKYTKWVNKLSRT